MVGLLRSARALKRAYVGSITSGHHAARQQAANEGLGGSSRGVERLFSSASSSGSKTAHEVGAKAKSELPTWGYVAIGAGAGGLYYYYKHHQSRVAENQSVGTTGGDRYTKVNNEMPAGAAAVPNPVPLPAFQGEDPVTGGPISLEDLKGDFAVMTFVDADDPKVAKDVLARLLQVIETIDRMTNMEYTQPVVIDLNECKKEGAESNQKGEKSGSKLKELINRFVGERASKKKDKSELRFRGISGEDATGKIKEAIKQFDSQKGADEEKGGQVPTEEVPVSHGRGDLHLITPEGTIVISFEEVAVPEDVAEEIAHHIYDYKHSHPTWHYPKAVTGRSA